VSKEPDGNGFSVQCKVSIWDAPPLLRTGAGRAILLAIIQHLQQDKDMIVAYLLSAGTEPSVYAIKKATLTMNTAILQLLSEKAWDVKNTNDEWHNRQRSIECESGVDRGSLGEWN
jgi:hypothetical protein